MIKVGIKIPRHKSLIQKAYSEFIILVELYEQTGFGVRTSDAEF